MSLPASAALLLLCLTADPAAPPAAPTPEGVLAGDDAAAYYDWAHQQLQADPDVARTSRIALDALMLATLQGDRVQAERMQVWLLGQAPQSLATAYLVSTFAKVDDLRAFLRKHFVSKDLTPDNARIAAGAVLAGLQRRGTPGEKPLLSDDDFALHSAWAADVAGEEQLSTAAQAALAGKRTPAARIVAAAFNPFATPRERFELLEPLRDEKKTASYLKLIDQVQIDLIDRFEPDQRQVPEIQRALARNLLTLGRLERALAVLEPLASAGDDPQVRFWHILCLCRLQRTSDADAALQRLTMQAKDSPWTTSAQRLVALQAGGAERRTALAVECEQVVKTMAESLGNYWELRVVSQAGKTPALDWLVVCDPSEHYFDCAVRRGAELFARYRTDKHSCRIYLKGETVSQRFTHAGWFPLPSLQINPDDPLHGTLNAGATLSSEEFVAGLTAVLQQPIFGERPAMLQALDAMHRSGAFIDVPQSTQRGTLYRFAKPRLDRPEFESSAFTFDEHHRLAHAAWESLDGKLEVTHCRYGKAGATLTPPDWPEVPVKVLNDKDWVEMFRLAARGLELLVNTLDVAETADLDFAQPKRQ